EQQRQAYFVKLVSPNILLSDQVRSFDDLMRLSDGPLGQMSQAEVTALASYLETLGVYLRYVSKDLRRAVIFGDVPSLVSVPTAPVNDGNFTTIQDESAGAMKVGSGTIAFGTVLISVVVAPATIGAAGETTLLVGAGVVAVGAGFLVTWGLLEIFGGDAPPPSPAPKQPSSDNIDMPNEVDDQPTGEVEIPSAVAMGSPDNGIDVLSLVDELATGTLDDVLSSFPIGWDSGSGTPLPGIGDLGGGDTGSGGSLGGDLGFG
ncbi:MAG TPA: hypothetical protein VNZ06_00960, partial [Steroidobacteraceae bacterium]|nr:hypothetical protein [Steroidobacteraceae bacterium]